MGWARETGVAGKGPGKGARPLGAKSAGAERGRAPFDGDRQVRDVHAGDRHGVGGVEIDGNYIPSKPLIYLYIQAATTDDSDAQR